MSDIGKLVLRGTVGGLMLFHGVSKISHGIGGIEGLLAAKGLPQFLAYGVYVGEVVAPVLLILGLWTKPAAWVFAFNMVVATGLAHSGDVFAMTPHGGWAIELQAFYILAAVAIALLGPGGISVSGGRGRFD